MKSIEFELDIASRDGHLDSQLYPTRAPGCGFHTSLTKQWAFGERNLLACDAQHRITMRQLF